MNDLGQGSDSTFLFPLLNSTGIKEMNVFVGGGNYAPKRASYTTSQLQNPVNITINSFNPNAINSVLTASSITMALYISNSTCDVPNPASACLVGGSQDMSSFNPMSAIMGGGKLSFRMGVGNISVHYVNVDMLASGPPDALFDSSTTDSTSGTFASALRFGSGGPTIYDYVLVSIPYTAGSSSQTGLSETGEVNISIPLLYDDNWNIIWNSTVNGTAAGALAGNNSHYSARQSEWANLLNQSTCATSIVTSASQLNSTNPCHIDTTNNKIWVRLPHFSGTGPSVTGNLITATASTTSSSESGGPSSSGAVEQKGHIFQKITPGVVAIKRDFNLDAGVKEIQIEVNSEAQNVKVTVSKYDSKPAAVSVEKTGKTYRYLEIKTENLAGKLKKAKVKVQIEKSWITDNGLTKEDVAVFKFDESSDKWNELPTVYSSEDDVYYYYSTTLSSFSYFTISEKTIVAEEIPKEILPEKERKISARIKVVIQVVIILAILAILVGSVVLLKKRKHRKAAKKRTKNFKKSK